VAGAERRGKWLCFSSIGSTCYEIWLSIVGSVPALGIVCFASAVPVVPFILPGMSPGKGRYVFSWGGGGGAGEFWFFFPKKCWPSLAS